MSGGATIDGHTGKTGVSSASGGANLIGTPDLQKVHHVFMVGDLGTQIRFPKGLSMMRVVPPPKQARRLTNCRTCGLLNQII